jgi:geranylgeranyl diphosphate synthase type II
LRLTASVISAPVLPNEFTAVVERKLGTYAAAVDERLDELLPGPTTQPPELAAAMRYSCLSPGKRLRPALCLAACEAVGGRVENALDAACALEMIHSFSLIHDDLPALDNDDLRRGKPTCHVVYGEAIAILAGDALFSLAFETIAAGNVLSPSAGQTLRCVQLLASSTGLQGLVAGETADILSEGKPVDLALLEFIHSHKTGALIQASCEIGATIGTSDGKSVEALKRYGAALGLAFQIADDVLDETSTAEVLGKSAGSDRANDKATYPKLMGIELSKARASELVSGAVEALLAANLKSDFLEGLAHFSISRHK